MVSILFDFPGTNARQSLQSKTVRSAMMDEDELRGVNDEFLPENMETMGWEKWQPNPVDATVGEFGDVLEVVSRTGFKPRTALSHDDGSCKESPVRRTYFVISIALLENHHFRRRCSEPPGSRRFQHARLSLRIQRTFCKGVP